MNERRNKLIEDNMMLYYAYINKYKYNKNYHPALIESIEYRCLLGYINACDKYQEGKAKFNTLAWTAMSNAYKNALAQNSTHKNQINIKSQSIDETREAYYKGDSNIRDDIEPRSADDIVKDMDDPVILKFINNVIDKELSQRDKELLLSHYVDGVKYKDLAKQYNLSSSNAQLKVNNAKKKIRRKYNEIYGSNSIS